MLYVSTAKNACTSLKWLVAELAGEDLTRFRPGLTAQLNDDAGVHQRNLWQRVPKLNQLSPELRRSIHPDNGWFVFGIVRDPRVRLFSAWESKYLLHDPVYRRWRGESWFPATPSTFDDVVESFARFVALLDKHPDHQVTHDSHFLSQTKLLRPTSRTRRSTRSPRSARRCSPISARTCRPRAGRVS